MSNSLHMEFLLIKTLRVQSQIVSPRIFIPTSRALSLAFLCLSSPRFPLPAELATKLLPIASQMSLAVFSSNTHLPIATTLCNFSSLVNSAWDFNLRALCEPSSKFLFLLAIQSSPLLSSLLAFSFSLVRSRQEAPVGATSREAFEDGQLCAVVEAILRKARRER